MREISAVARKLSQWRSSNKGICFQRYSLQILLNYAHRMRDRLSLEKVIKKKTKKKNLREGCFTEEVRVVNNDFWGLRQTIRLEVFKSEKFDCAKQNRALMRRIRRGNGPRGNNKDGALVMY